MAKVAWQWQAIRLTRCSEWEERPRACGGNAVGEAPKDGKLGRNGWVGLAREGRRLFGQLILQQFHRHVCGNAHTQLPPCPLQDLLTLLRYARARLGEVDGQFLPVDLRRGFLVLCELRLQATKRAKIIQHFKQVRTGNSANQANREK